MTDTTGHTEYEQARRYHEQVEIHLAAEMNTESNPDS
jgi:hypothetical protein